MERFGQNPAQGLYFIVYNENASPHDGILTVDSVALGIDETNLLRVAENKQAQVERMIAKAYRADSYSQAKTSLEILADKLQLEGYQSAASSLREGMSETLTVLKLGVDPGLCKTLSNTNPIESAFSVYAACSKHVKRWRNGRQAPNWIGLGLLKAEDGFQRIANPDGLEKLADVLTRHAQSGVPAYQSKAASAA